MAKGVGTAWIGNRYTHYAYSSKRSLTVVNLKVFKEWLDAQVRSGTHTRPDRQATQAERGSKSGPQKNARTSSVSKTTRKTRVQQTVSANL